MPVLDLWLQHGFAETVFAGLTSNARSSWRRRFGSSTCISRGRGPSQCPIQNRPRLKPSDRQQLHPFRSRRRFQRTCSRFVRWTWDWTRSPGDFKLWRSLNSSAAVFCARGNDEMERDITCLSYQSVCHYYVSNWPTGHNPTKFKWFFHLWLFLRH